MFPWGHLHILVTSLWDLPLTPAWEATRAPGWATVAPAQVITAWEDQAQSIRAWADLLQDILPWEARHPTIPPWDTPAPYTRGWGGPVLYTPAWEALGLSLCLLRRFILQTNPWCSTHRTPTLHQYIPVASAIKRFTTMIR